MKYIRKINIKKDILPFMPGILATLLTTLVTGLWTFWSLGEMFFEGWYGRLWPCLAYLIPGTVCLLMSLAALKWPKFGGYLLITIGALFTIWWWGEDIIGGSFTLKRALAQFPVSAMIMLVGGLFLWYASRRKKRRLEGWQVPSNWWLRNLRFVIFGGVELIILISVLAVNLPIVLTRMDDGNREARLIEGNDVSLVWAPLGPGWNWKQDFGGYPSWDSLARYGQDPIGMEGKSSIEMGPASLNDMQTTGLCRFLNENGDELLNEAQNIWRMPTTDEIVRSMARHGENAGCLWDGDFHKRVICDILPDKETPLWAPDMEPVYYWTADEGRNEREAVYVSYNGWVKEQPKSWGNPRHGYRCVKEVD